ncbi:hypothetical protein [Psittacicella hinzii]|uniref:hypothetical protein n=1 Tax=Psittacicella hinzii TaxID=2028575 RepID=UPI0011C38EAF|nr:hypothetical protein [Psittacicella hinzii]
MTTQYLEKKQQAITLPLEDKHKKLTQFALECFNANYAICYHVLQTTSTMVFEHLELISNLSRLHESFYLASLFCMQKNGKLLQQEQNNQVVIAHKEKKLQSCIKQLSYKLNQYALDNAIITNDYQINLEQSSLSDNYGYQLLTTTMLLCDPDEPSKELFARLQELLQNKEYTTLYQQDKFNPAFFIDKLELHQVHKEANKGKFFDPSIYSVNHDLGAIAYLKSFKDLVQSLQSFILNLENIERFKQVITGYIHSQVFFSYKVRVLQQELSPYKLQIDKQLKDKEVEVKDISTLSKKERKALEVALQEQERLALEEKANQEAYLLRLIRNYVPYFIYEKDIQQGKATKRICFNALGVPKNLANSLVVQKCILQLSKAKNNLAAIKVQGLNFNTRKYIEFLQMFYRIKGSTCDLLKILYKAQNSQYPNDYDSKNTCINQLEILINTCIDLFGKSPLTNNAVAKSGSVADNNVTADACTQNCNEEDMNLQDTQENEKQENRGHEQEKEVQENGVQEQENGKQEKQERSEQQDKQEQQEKDDSAPDDSSQEEMVQKVYREYISNYYNSVHRFDYLASVFRFINSHTHFAYLEQYEQLMISLWKVEEQIKNPQALMIASEEVPKELKEAIDIINNLAKSSSQTKAAMLHKYFINDLHLEQEYAAFKLHQQKVFSGIAHLAKEVVRQSDEELHAFAQVVGKFLTAKECEQLVNLNPEQQQALELLLVQALKNLRASKASAQGENSSTNNYTTNSTADFNHVLTSGSLSNAFKFLALKHLASLALPSFSVSKELGQQGFVKEYFTFKKAKGKKTKLRKNKAASNKLRDNKSISNKTARNELVVKTANSVNVLQYDDNLELDYMHWQLMYQQCLAKQEYLYTRDLSLLLSNALANDAEGDKYYKHKILKLRDTFDVSDEQLGKKKKKNIAKQSVQETAQKINKQSTKQSVKQTEEIQPLTPSEIKELGLKVRFSSYTSYLLAELATRSTANKLLSIPLSKSEKKRAALQSLPVVTSEQLILAEEDRDRLIQIIDLVKERTSKEKKEIFDNLKADLQSYFSPENNYAHMRKLSARAYVMFDLLYRKSLLDYKSENHRKATLDYRCLPLKVLAPTIELKLMHFLLEGTNSDLTRLQKSRSQLEILRLSKKVMDMQL